MKRLLIVGAVPDFKNNLRFGGATILMQNFIDFLDEKKIKYKFAQTNKFSNLETGKKRPVLNKIFLLYKFLLYIWVCDTIMFNFSDNGVVYAMPLLLRVAKLLDKKIVLRKFGGSFEIFLEKLPEDRYNKTLENIKQCDLIFFETKAGIDHLKTITTPDINIHWFPNVRNISKAHKDSRQFNKRLGFISQICDEKGIADILSIAKVLYPEYIIDLYGYIAEEKYENFDWKSHHVNYHGEISSEQVPDILKGLLLLLLPSYREGYPGIVIESLSVGLPVLTTTAGGIPEIITDGLEGFLITPGDVNAAVNKIRQLTPNKYKIMCQHAQTTFNKKFESKSTNERVLNLIKKLR